MKWLRSIPPEIGALLIIALPLFILGLMRILVINHPGDGFTGLVPLSDPDPWLRLSLVRDWLSSGGWFDHIVHRSNAPEGGIATPWTRPLDLVIAGLVYLQPGDEALTVKLLRAAALLPFIWMSLLLLGLYRALQRLESSPISPYFVTFLLICLPMVWDYFGRGNADHHGMLAASWAWVLAYAVGTHRRLRDDWMQGLLLALMLWISPEALVLIAVCFSWPLLVWLKEVGRLHHAASLTSATFYGSVLALSIERGPGTWLTPIYDSISIVHVLALGLCALATRLLLLMPSRASLLLRVAACGTLSGALITIMAICYPLFFKGPMAEVDSFIFTDFLPLIQEAQPLLKKHPLYAAAILFAPCVALAFLAGMLVQGRGLFSRPQAAQFCWFLLATIALVLVQLRWNYYLFPLVVLVLGSIFGGIFAPQPDQTEHWPVRLLKKHSEMMQALFRTGLFVALLCLPVLFLNLQPKQLPRTQSKACETLSRKMLMDGSLVRLLGNQPQILYAPTNLGGDILFFTPYRIVASNYHREGKALRYHWGAQYVNDTAQLPVYFAPRQVDTLLLCPTSNASPKSALQRIYANPALAPEAWQSVPLPEAYRTKPAAPRLFRLTPTH
jgi:hypothetical protein